jgi:hypothetical protein
VFIGDFSALANRQRIFCAMRLAEREEPESNTLLVVDKYPIQDLGAFERHSMADPRHEPEEAIASPGHAKWARVVDLLNKTIDSMKLIISAATPKFFQRYAAAAYTTYCPSWYMIRTLEALD